MQKNISSLIEEIRKRNAHRVLLQLPEGLRMRSISMADELKKAGVDVVLSNDPCYGACDIKDECALQASCDLIVHIGHNKFYRDFRTTVPVLYYPWEAQVTINEIDFSILKEKKVGILTSIQHMKLIDGVKKALESYGKEVFAGGQILGCWTVNAEKIAGSVDAFIFIGTGKFHPLRLKNKPVYVIDLEKMKLEKVDSALFEKIRYGRIYKAMDAKSFGILVSSKKGQFELQKKAEEIKSMLEKNGKKAHVIIMDEITNSKLMGISVDAFINTACPRITDDVFDKPIINAEDLHELFQE